MPVGKEDRNRRGPRQATDVGGGRKMRKPSKAETVRPRVKGAATPTTVGRGTRRKEAEAADVQAAKTATATALVVSERGKGVLTKQDLEDLQSGKRFVGKGKGDAPAIVQPETLAPVLLAQPADSPARELLRLLYEPASVGKPLGYLVEKAGMDLEEIVALAETYHLAIGKLATLPHAPEILEDVAIDAKSRLATCEKCIGSGKHHVMMGDGMGGQTYVPTAYTCPACDGIGKIRKVGDKQARVLMFEALGLVGKAKGPLVAIQNNITTSTPQASHVAFSQKLLEAGRKAGK